MTTVFAPSLKVPLPIARSAHRFSALVIGAFSVLHLSNHLLTPFGPGVHRAAQEWLRGAYRGPVLEPLLFFAVLTQTLSGLRLWAETRGNPALRWQRRSGLFLSFFLLVHSTAALVQRFVAGLDTNFYWAASVLAWPLCLAIIPYYVLAIVSLFVHVGLVSCNNSYRHKCRGSAQEQSGSTGGNSAALIPMGCGISVSNFGDRALVTRRWSLRLAVVLGLLVSLIVIGGLLGAFTSFELPAEYAVVK
jgi:hypothetical protein